MSSTLTTDPDTPSQVPSRHRCCFDVGGRQKIDSQFGGCSDVVKAHSKFIVWIDGNVTKESVEVSATLAVVEAKEGPDNEERPTTTTATTSTTTTISSSNGELLD